MEDHEIIARLNHLYEKHPKLFSEWDAAFVTDNRGRQFYSDKQRDAARAILSKVESDPKKAGENRQDMWENASVCDQCEEGVVIMLRPFENKDRSQRLERRETYERLDGIHQYREAAFACTCERGALRKTWQRYRNDARDAWLAGWRTRTEYFKESSAS